MKYYSNINDVKKGSTFVLTNKNYNLIQKALKINAKVICDINVNDKNVKKINIPGVSLWCNRLKIWLSLQWFRLLLGHGVDPWPRNFHSKMFWGKMQNISLFYSKAIQGGILLFPSFLR